MKSFRHVGFSATQGRTLMSILTTVEFKMGVIATEVVTGVISIATVISVHMIYHVTTMPTTFTTLVDTLLLLPSLDFLRVSLKSFFRN